MNILYYDCFAGISGDMNIAALLDLGVDFDYLSEQIKLLNIEKEYELEVHKADKNGIYGTKFNVHLHNEQDEHQHEHQQHININHKHNHQHHNHRNLYDIEKIIKDSSLKEAVKTLSLNIFRRIAIAEGRIHNKSFDEVHFHEVGAIDSIIDVVGSAICLDYLKVDKVISTPIELGGGFIKCQHGTIPVPAPATLEILKDIPVKLNNVKHEATTPTGAAILAETADEFSYLSNAKIKKIGYGIGTRNMEIPNVLRVCIAEV